MKTIKVNEKEYSLEFSFEAVEKRDFIKQMYELVSGAYFIKNASDKNEPSSMDIINGGADMIAELPHICKNAFYIGLLENQPEITETEAKALMKEYMKANKLSFLDLNRELQECMVEDGFFELSGLTEMLNQMSGQKEKKTTKK